MVTTILCVLFSGPKEFSFFRHDALDEAVEGHIRVQKDDADRSADKSRNSYDR
jgi:hypothetical protein